MQYRPAEQPPSHVLLLCLVLCCRVLSSARLAGAHQQQQAQGGQARAAAHPPLPAHMQVWSYPASSGCLVSSCMCLHSSQQPTKCCRRTCSSPYGLRSTGEHSGDVWLPSPQLGLSALAVKAAHSVASSPTFVPAWLCSSRLRACQKHCVPQGLPAAQLQQLFQPIAGQQGSQRGGPHPLLQQLQVLAFVRA